MLLQLHDDGDIPRLTKIVGGAHIIQRLKLDHKMVEALGRPGTFANAIRDDADYSEKKRR
jgi:hypothetical protein